MPPPEKECVYERAGVVPWKLTVGTRLRTYSSRSLVQHPLNHPLLLFTNATLNFYACHVMLCNVMSCHVTLCHPSHFLVRKGGGWACILWSGRGGPMRFLARKGGDPCNLWSGRGGPLAFLARKGADPLHFVVRTRGTPCILWPGKGGTPCNLWSRRGVSLAFCGPERGGPLHLVVRTRGDPLRFLARTKGDPSHFPIRTGGGACMLIRTVRSGRGVLALIHIYSIVYALLNNASCTRDCRMTRTRIAIL
jgi:hypothetical protein